MGYAYICTDRGPGLAAKQHAFQRGDGGLSGWRIVAGDLGQPAGLGRLGNTVVRKKRNTHIMNVTNSVAKRASDPRLYSCRTSNSYDSLQNK